MARKGRPSLVELHRDLIIRTRLEFPNLSKKDFYNHLVAARNKQVTEKYQKTGEKFTSEAIRAEANADFPGDSAVFKYLDEIDPKIRERQELDQSWTIGAQIDPLFRIEPTMIPILFEMFNLWPDFSISIRGARWFANLYPAYIDRVVKKFPDDRTSQLEAIITIIGAYSRAEMVGEVTGNKLLNTNELDSMFFMEDDDTVSESEFTLRAYLGMTKAQMKKLKENRDQVARFAEQHPEMDDAVMAVLNRINEELSLAVNQNGEAADTSAIFAKGAKNLEEIRLKAEQQERDK